jgi:transcriptional antiterminator RfaH
MTKRQRLVCYVARAKNGRELWAGHNIRNQGHQYYLPMLYDAKQKRPRPLFPGYNFPITTGPWYFLRGTFGIAGLVMNGENPATLLMSEIDKLRALENEFGHIQLPKAAEFEQNDPVRIKTGAMAGYVGLYQGMASTDRVRVLLEVLGGPRSVLIAGGLLESAA